MVETRPDIAFSITVAARFAKNSSHAHIKAVKTILRYLKGSMDCGIIYGDEGEPLSIKGYSDSNWAGDKESHRSTSGFIFILNRGPVSWCSKRQATVALSSMEAKYIALTLAAKEATWLRLLLTKLGLLQPHDPHAKIFIKENNISAEALLTNATVRGGGEEAIPLRGDNQSSIALAHNPVLHSRTKHIDIQHHYIWDDISAGEIQLTYMPTAEMIADGLTKPLTHAKFHGFLEQMHMT